MVQCCTYKHPMRYLCIFLVAKNYATFIKQCNVWLDKWILHITNWERITKGELMLFLFESPKCGCRRSAATLAKSFWMVKLKWNASWKRQHLSLQNNAYMLSRHKCNRNLASAKNRCQSGYLCDHKSLHKRLAN